MLRKSPGALWTAEIPEKFKNLTIEEVKQLLLESDPGSTGEARTRYVTQTPDSWSWDIERPDCAGPRTIRDQGGCGSCWAFSAVNELSDNRCISRLDGRRVQYSEEYVISCDHDDFGCSGGWPDQVQRFLLTRGTSDNECVPYRSGATNESGVCPVACSNGEAIATTRSSRMENVCAGEEAIKAALTLGAVQTYFKVYSDFMYYSGGIYHHRHGPKQGLHAVEMIGYGTRDGAKYWNVKNSWGNDWGEDGYFRILRGQNECGIEKDCYLLTP